MVVMPEALMLGLGASEIHLKGRVYRAGVVCEEKHTNQQHVCE